MLKWSAIILVFLLFATTSFSDDRAACGLNGTVYASDSTPAGNLLYNIVVCKVGGPGIAGYNYDATFSTYRIYCQTGLTQGNWKAYAVTYENGQYRYSGWKRFYWEPHISCGVHDFYCTRTTPPPAD